MTTSTSTASGNDYIISAQVPATSGYVTEQEMNDAIESATSGKQDTLIFEYNSESAISAINGSAIADTSNVTTEEGQFTVHPNLEGADVTVIYPTDVAPVSGFYDLNYNYDDEASNRTGPSVFYYVFKSPGYDNGTWSANDGDVIQIKVNEAIQGVGAIYGFYPFNNSPAGSNGPSINYPASGPLVTGTGASYTVEPGVYTVALGSNPAGSNYGKYICLAVNKGGSGTYVDDILDKIEFTFGRPNAELGATVNLSRYYLSNPVNSSTLSSELACQLNVDSTTKQQKVYLPGSIPNSWTGRIAQYIEYGSNYLRVGGYNTSQQYIAYKQSSNPTRYQYAFCTDYDYTNKMMTFISYNESGQAIEKWTVDYSNYSTNVWTTETISPDMSEYISYSASGVYLPNSKFEIDTEGQAYKIISEGSETSYSKWSDGGIYFTPQYSQVGTYKATFPSNTDHLVISQGGGIGFTSTYDSTTHIAIFNVSELPNGAYALVWAKDSSDNWVQIEPNNTTIKYQVPAVTEEYITESDLTSAVSGYANEQYVQDAIASGTSAFITSADLPDVSNFVTQEDIDASVSGKMDASESSATSAFITSADLPSEEEVQFEELDLSSFVDSAYVSDYVASQTSGKQDTLTFTYDSSDKISAINGSAIAGGGGGGGSYTAGEFIDITNDVISVASGDVSNLIPGSGILITQSSAGTTVSIDPEEMPRGYNETVLWSGEVSGGQTAELSEDYSAFSEIKFKYRDWNPTDGASNHTERFDTDATKFVTICGWQNNANTSRAIFIGSYSATDSNHIKLTDAVFTNGGTTWSNGTGGYRLLQVVGINRKES